MLVSNVERTRIASHRITIDSETVESLQVQASREYPNECCGVLLGRWRQHEGHSVTSVVRGIPSVNTANDRSRNYAIAPESLYRLHKDLLAEPIEIVGYYHSHPVGEATPSETDRRAAWPGVSYLVIAPYAIAAAPIRSWRLDSGGTAFCEERLEITFASDQGNE